MLQIPSKLSDKNDNEENKSLEIKGNLAPRSVEAKGFSESNRFRLIGKGRCWKNILFLRNDLGMAPLVGPTEREKSRLVLRRREDGARGR